MNDHPHRGDIYWVDFHPGRGSEQLGRRPALIIQNDVGNKYAATTIIAAVSTSLHPSPTNVIISPDKSNGLKQRSCVKLSQLLTIDQSRLFKKLGCLSKTQIEQVDAALRLSLNLE